MRETIQIVRIFLASPGDLKEERQLANEAIQELNRHLAPYFGFRLELKGWEDTISGTGRPQAIINKELDLCELFIGIMWRRWGTPPSKEGSYLYSSGFEEEFERASLNRNQTGQPEMAMYFKEVSSDILVDPGEDLKKVINFKKRLEKEKQIYFEEFKNSEDFQKCFRLKVTNYLILLKETSKKEKETESKGCSLDGNGLSGIRSPFSEKGHKFLEDLLNKTKDEEDTNVITSLEVARLRLLSASISRPENHEIFLGVHDANIIYMNKDVDYGKNEVSTLIECGLKNISYENVPLWYWSTYQNCDIKGGVLLSRTLSSNNAVAVGALEAMRIIGASLPSERREFYVNEWLSENSSENVKVASLKYLKECGIKEDIPFLESEISKSDSKTSLPALEALLEIQYSYNPTEAFKTAILNQSESIDVELLTKILNKSSELEEDVLTLGIKNGNKIIRLESFKRLAKKKKLFVKNLEELKHDPSAFVREQVVFYMQSNNMPLSDEEIKSIFIQPKKPEFGFFGIGSADYEGTDCYEIFLFKQYCRLGEKKLSEKIEDGIPLNEKYYFALCTSYFKKYCEGLRKNIDDQFKSAFEEYIKHLQSLGFPDQEIAKTKDLEDFIRKNLTRKGLDILCEKGGSKDIDRVRKGMRSGQLKSSSQEISYIGRFGCWEDISFILKAKEPYDSRTTFFSNSSKEWDLEKARAIYSITKKRFEELLKEDIDYPVLVELLRMASSKDFSKVSKDVLFGLFNNKNDKVRKISVLKSVVFFPKMKLSEWLNEFLLSNGYRYYNLIFWLDFGVSLPNVITKHAVKMLIKNC